MTEEVKVRCRNKVPLQTVGDWRFHFESAEPGRAVAVNVVRRDPDAFKVGAVYTLMMTDAVGAK